MVGVGKGAEAGILIRGAEHLEQALRLTTVVFDKTGTLTRGEPQVTDIILAPGGTVTEDEMVRLAAAVEVRSEHPLATALVPRARALDLDLPPVDECVATPGQGVSGVVEHRSITVGNSWRSQAVRISRAARGGDGPAAGRRQDGDAFVGGRDRAGRHRGRRYRQGARGPGGRLSKEQGVQVVMLTGDNEATARAVARQLGIDRVIANVLSADKAHQIQLLRDSGEIVAMVGDGVNDAAALATANIGIALGSGSDAAKETGCIILIRDHVRHVATSIRLSRATM